MLSGGEALELSSVNWCWALSFLPHVTTRWLLAVGIQRFGIIVPFLEFSQRIDPRSPIFGKKTQNTMAVAFSNLPRWLWSQKNHESAISTPSSASPSSSPSPPSQTSTVDMREPMRDPEVVKFSSMQEARFPSTPRRVRRKWHSRSERRMDKEYDVVLVPSDGGCMSGSESDDSDWSIGWFEPHAPEFSTENDSENSFAVLVPCYGLASSEPVDSRRVFSAVAENSKNQLLEAILSNLSNGSSSDSKRYMEQWLSSLHEH